MKDNFWKRLWTGQICSLSLFSCTQFLFFCGFLQDFLFPYFQQRDYVHRCIGRVLWHFFCCSVTRSCLSICDPHGLQHSRLPFPSLSPGVCSNSCPLSWWCHPIISFSLTSFSFCPQSFPAAGSFSWVTSGGQSIGVSVKSWIQLSNWTELKC